MSENQSCLVAALGLQEHEIRLVKSILRHGNGRDHGRYEWTDNFQDAHMVMVSADNDAAVKSWQALSNNLPNNQPLPILILVTPKVADNSVAYFFSRPFAPSKILSVLEKAFQEKLASIFEESVFNDFENVSQRENEVSGQIKGVSACRALVVDDSPTVLKQLELELNRLHIQVDKAETGEQCLEMVAQAQYDIIFLDVVLPGQDGYEICKKIKKDQTTRQIPVIMLTSKSSSFDRVRGAMAGCNSYLTKPVDYAKFHKALENHLTGK